MDERGLPQGVTAEQVTKWKTEHGELLELEASTGERVIFRSPRGAVWNRFRMQVQDERRRLAAVENLVRGCLVYPQMPAFEEMLERRPGLIESFGGSLVEHAGMSDRVEKKVL